MALQKNMPMINNVELALETAKLCQQYKTEYEIRINGNVEVDLFKDIEKDKDFYYQTEGVQLSSLNELHAFEFRLKYRMPPD